VEELDSLDKRAAGRRFKMDTYKGWVLGDW
jgi:hypothetical protein